MPISNQTIASSIHPHQIPTLQASADLDSFERAFAKYLTTAPHKIHEPGLIETPPAPSGEAKPPQPTQTTNSEVQTTPAPRPGASNRAVIRCSHAYNQAFKSAIQNGKTQYSATTDAERAYRNTMPPLSGQDNIRDFIACTAHAMLIGAINGADGARLLYAAQVAYQASASAEVKPASTRGPGRPRTTPFAPDSPIEEK